MAKQDLEIKKIDDLRSKKFLIPNYQRGYRWSEIEVEDLLNDVLDFVEDPQTTNQSIYCLQPVVVTAKGDKWEVIDGQQRLTTIYLILRYLNLGRTEDRQLELYEIEYATREGSQEFLKNIDEAKDEARQDENIDYFHIYTAFKTIADWFRARVAMEDDIRGAILRQVIVIWYQVHDASVDPKSIFTRLNIGKIPLTQSELIKALFLQEKNFRGNAANRERRQIASEWDQMEKALRNDAFWFFITNDRTRTNRIEFVLELVAAEIGASRTLSHDKLGTFIAFYEKGKEEGVFPTTKLWEQIKSVFMTVEEWHQNPEFFHLVGFMIAAGTPARALYKEYRAGSSRPVFRKYLFSEIYHALLDESLDGTIEPDELEASIADFVETLTYEGGETIKKKLRLTLLLFNIATLLRGTESNQRFQFDRFKSEEWDIEHVRSVASEIKRDNVPAQKKWAADYVSYYLERHIEPGDEIDLSPINSPDIRALCQQAVDVLRSEPFDQDTFFDFFTKAIAILNNPDIEENDSEPATETEIDNQLVDHGLGNLALLDRETNRGYKNAIFPIKRQIIIDLDKKGRFIPLCTKNVFLKYYSGRNVTDMFVWSKKDARAYKREIVDTLTDFFLNARTAD